MSKFVTIQEAAKLADVSDSTIRRAIKAMPKHDQQNVKKIAGKIYISFTWISSKYPLSPEPAEPQYSPHSALEATQRQIDALIDENRTQAAELREAWQIIAALREKLASLGTGERNQPPEHDTALKIIIIILIILAFAFLWAVVVS